MKLFLVCLVALLFSSCSGEEIATVIRASSDAYSRYNEARGPSYPPAYIGY